MNIWEQALDRDAKSRAALWVLRKTPETGRSDGNKTECTGAYAPPRGETGPTSPRSLPNDAHLLRSILEFSPGNIIVVNQDGFVVFCSEAARRTFGGNKLRLEGTRIAELLPGISVCGGAVMAPRQNAGAEIAPVTLKCADGAICRFELFERTLCTESGQKYTAITLNDVSRRVAAERRVRTLEQRWHAALENSEIAVFEYDLTSGEEIVSDAWYRLVGISDLKGMTHEQMWMSRVHPDDLERILPAERACIEGRSERAVSEYRLIGESGDWRWIRSVFKVAQRDMDGRAQKILGTMSDITSLREATEIAEAKKADLKRMILRAPLAMAYLDGAGKILMLNEAGHDLLGRAGEVLCGRDFWELLGPSLEGETGSEICRRASEDPLGYKERKTFLRPDGTRIRCVMTVAALSSETSGDGAFIVELVDITEQEHLADLRNEFISLVSHELRTPIASVYGSVSLVKGVLKDDPPEAISRLLDVAKRNCQRLKRLADDLLDVQYIHSGCFKLDLEKSDILEIVRGAVSSAEPAARRNDVSFAISCDAEAITSEVDPARLGQAVGNILSNAAKHSPTGAEVEVDIHADDTCYRISVTDHGSGIAPEFRSRMFTPFSQQAEHSTRKHEGSGLGLVIAKALVEAMGGKIDYVSEPGVRTMFWVELPVK